MHISLFRPQISEEAIQAAANVLRSGWLGLGPQTEAFENALPHTPDRRIASV